MTTKIDKKITGYKVLDKPTSKPASKPVKRPSNLNGTTYKISTPQSNHALYVTINNRVVNDTQIPFEIFINSREIEHYQWVSALTMVISACFRKGGDVAFLADELMGVFDPKGGYFKKGGVFMPSLVAEIGLVIETHLKSLGLIEEDIKSDIVKEFIAQKKEEFNGIPETATVCPKCSVKAAVIMDGCSTCLSCGDSKCG